MLGRHSLLKRCNASRRLPSAFLRQHTTLKTQHNQKIIDLLSKQDKEVEESKLDTNYFKVQAFTNAIYAVGQFDQPIRSGNDMLKIQGIGSGIISRVNDYLLSTDSLSSDPVLLREVRNSQYIKQLTEIPGIGPTTAKKLVQAGCYSLKDLQSGQFSSLLSVKQLAKIKFAGYLEPVQRQDATDVLAFCSDGLESQYECTLVGDYRRGFVTFPEICLMLSHPDFVHVPLPNFESPDAVSEKRPRGRRKADDRTNLLHTDVIPVLQQRGLIAETLSVTYKSWEGIVRLPGQQTEWNSRAERISAITSVEGLYRKMTIHFVPRKSRGSSLICLTGDSDFEKDISYRASQRNLLFNEYGLWKWMKTPPEPVPDDAESNPISGPEHGYWSLINCSTEEEIFKELGMEPIDPARRNFSFVSSKRSRRKRTSTLPAYH